MDVRGLSRSSPVSEVTSCLKKLMRTIIGSEYSTQLKETVSSLFDSTNLCLHPSITVRTLIGQCLVELFKKSAPEIPLNHKGTLENALRLLASIIDILNKNGNPEQTSVSLLIEDLMNLDVHFIVYRAKTCSTFLDSLIAAATPSCIHMAVEIINCMDNLSQDVIKVLSKNNLATLDVVRRIHLAHQVKLIESFQLFMTEEEMAHAYTYMAKILPIPFSFYVSSLKAHIYSENTIQRRKAVSLIIKMLPESISDDDRSSIMILVDRHVDVDPMIRILIVELCGKVNFEECLSVLYERANDNETRVRKAAMHQLSLKPCSQLDAYLIAEKFHDQCPEVSEMAVLLLTKMVIEDLNNIDVFIEKWVPNVTFQSAMKSIHSVWRISEVLETTNRVDKHIDMIKYYSMDSSINIEEISEIKDKITLKKVAKAFESSLKLQKQTIISMGTKNSLRILESGMLDNTDFWLIDCIHNNLKLRNCALKALGHNYSNCQSLTKYIHWHSLPPSAIVRYLASISHQIDHWPKSFPTITSMLDSLIEKDRKYIGDALRCYSISERRNISFNYIDKGFEYVVSLIQTLLESMEDVSSEQMCIVARKVEQMSVDHKLKIIDVIYKGLCQPQSPTCLIALLGIFTMDTNPLLVECSLKKIRALVKYRRAAQKKLSDHYSIYPEISLPLFLFLASSLKFNNTRIHTYIKAVDSPYVPSILKHVSARLSPQMKSLLQSITLMCTENKAPPNKLYAYLAFSN